MKGNIIREFTGHSYLIKDAKFSPCGNYILTASWDKSAILYHIDGSMIHKFTGHTLFVNAVAFNPVYNQIATGSDDTTAKLWDIDSLQLL